ncbi:hypothetical protein BJY52DRAFT_1189804 [Lactarius psammicola]|nr:hypothetical protein BJY52DRAFT_1189804 [Lactarius psammicola]
MRRSISERRYTHTHTRRRMLMPATDIGDDKMILDFRFVSLVLAAVAVTHGTYYSLCHNTYLDASKPFLVVHPHVLTAIHAFVSKCGPPNNLDFFRCFWFMFTATFFALQVPSISHTYEHPRFMMRRACQWYFATEAWYACIMEFSHGGSILARLAIASGAECGLQLSPASFVPIPTSFCAPVDPITRAAHPELFPLVLVPAFETESYYRPFEPRLRGGHDVSGHVVVLTLAVLFFADQLRQTRAVAYVFVRAAVGALLVLWVFSLWVTSVYFHSPLEKTSGFLIGVACFIYTQIPVCFDFISMFVTFGDDRVIESK